MAVKPNRFVAIAVVLSLCCVMFCGCQKKEEPDFSGFERIAELATLECTFHNVAEIYNDGTDMLFGINVGYKKAWFEYDGKVELGVDVSKVKIEGPDANNVVTITIPKAQVLGLPDADESTFSDIYQDTGVFTKITAVDKSEAYKLAQSNMRETAENDSVLMEQAQTRAKTLLGQFVLNIGEKQERTYELKFVDAE